MMPQDQCTLAFRIQVCARAFRFPWPSPVSCEAWPEVRQGEIAPLQALLGARSPPRGRSCRFPLSQYHTPKSQARAVRNSPSAQRYSLATLRPLGIAGIFSAFWRARNTGAIRRPLPPPRLLPPGLERLEQRLEEVAPSIEGKTNGYQGTKHPS